MSAGWRKAAKRLADQAEDGRRVAGAPAGAVAYIGPRVPGNRNLGDELLWWAHVRGFADLSLIQLTRLPRHTPRSGLVRGTVLGGGTLIGSPTFRRGLEAALAQLGDRPVVNLGTGVDDPVMPSTGRRGDATELRAWLPLLRRLPTVWVRGPRSQQALSDLGLESRISGDPVLMFARDADLQPRLETGRVGLNIGITGQQWHADPQVMVRELVSVGRHLLRRGLEVVPLSIWDADDEVTRALGGELGVRPVLAAELRSIRQTRATFAGIDLLVGMKLHAVVGAALVGTPAIALEYRPKCLDFQESVGAGKWSVRTSEMTADRVADLVGEALAARSSLASALADQVRARVAALTVAADESAAYFDVRGA